MKYLILIDRKFPFKNGEAFLENEIEEISLYFDKIIIFPTDASSKEIQTRVIKSKNVIVKPFGYKDYKHLKLQYALNSIKYIFSKNNEGQKLKEKIYEAFFLSISNIQTKKIIKKLNEIPFSSNDEVYIYSYWFYTTAKVAIDIRNYFNRLNIKTDLFSRAHRFDIYLNETKMNYLPNRKFLFENIDKLYACSENGADYLKEKYPQYTKKIGVSYLGTYDHGLKKDGTNKALNIVSCSRVNNIKRVTLIAQALKKIDDSDANITWTHIGTGNCFEELNREVSKLQNIRVNLIGAVSNEKVYEYYKNNYVDLFINVSTSEGLPVSIMEATSFGIPVIATNVGGTNEIVINNKNGFLIDKDFELDELVSLITLFKNHKNVEKYGKESRKIWEKNYNAKLNYKNFCEEVLKQKS